MFWNPAAVTTKNGINTEAHAAIIIGDSHIDLDTPVPSGSGNIAQGALVPSSYFNYQLSDRLFLGMSINSPFGLTTKPDNLDYLGSNFALTSKLFTMNAAPTVGYKLMPGVSVAAGVQVQYIKARLTSAPGGNLVTVKGDDVGFGFTAGVLLEPTASTKIGLGFRSSIAQKLDGTLTAPGQSTAITAEADLPEIVTLSLRQAISPRLTFLGTVEWTNWSRVKELIFIDKATGDQATINALGDAPAGEALNYEDGWFFSVGLEYQYNPVTLLRAGIAYEISPIRTDEDRGFRIPDNDRIWLSIGTTYKWSDHISIDTAYTHIFVKDGGIEEDLGGTTFSGSTQAHVDILSASLKMKF